MQGYYFGRPTIVPSWKADGPDESETAETLPPGGDRRRVVR